MFLSAGCALLRAEGFSCSLGVLYGGLGISKWQFLIKKIKLKFPTVNFFSILGHQTLDPDPGSGSGIRIRNYKKCWIRIRIRIRIKSMRIRNPGIWAAQVRQIYLIFEGRIISSAAAMGGGARSALFGVAMS